MLSWSLTICTYNRPQFLLKTLAHALAQTRRPAEIVVVDGSDAWREHRAQVLARFGGDLFGETDDDGQEDAGRVRLVYVPAEVRSLTFQRNQALRLARGDIVFSLDDDIYLWPDAAEIILRGYEADTRGEIAMIAGHFTPGPPPPLSASEDGPDDGRACAQAPDQGAEAWAGARSGLAGRLARWIDGQLSLAGHFVPYDVPIDVTPPPESVAHLALYPAGLINGGRTTFRRALALRTGWSEILRYYATHEDSDFSYRMSRHGRLLTAPDAGYYHADGNDGAVARFRVNTIRVRNLMALHALHSPRRARSALRLAGSFGKFLALYLLIDPAQKRWSFPTARAYAYGLVQVPVFLFWPFADFGAWYTALQERMYGTRYKS
jgi:GT2 family glycosyltransferase